MTLMMEAGSFAETPICASLSDAALARES